MEGKKREIVSDGQLRELFPDLPRGPLDGYRKQATFDWRRMKLSYDTLAAMKLKVSYFSRYYTA